MNLSNKDYYFLTNNTTFFRYFVDNSTGKPQKYLYYPTKYQQMSDKQIKKYQSNLIYKFIWWGLRNKQKLVDYDYKVCKSVLFDMGVCVVGTFLIARFMRLFMFRQEMVTIQAFMDKRNMDVRFWKSFAAYGITFAMGYNQFTALFKQRFLTDLAIQYSPNYTKPNQLVMPQIQPVLNKFYNQRFPWLATQPTKQN